MKKSVRIWAAAFVLSLLPLGYVTAEFFKLPLIWDPLYGYLSLGFGLVCSMPLWGAVLARAAKRTNQQDALGVIALLVSYSYAFISGDQNYYWQPTAITSLLLLGGWILHVQINFVPAQVKNLAALLPSKATLIDGREVEHIASADLEIGQVILVRPGSVIPADGYVIQGQSLVSQTKITGESASLMKVPGDWVIAGSENVAGKGAANAPLTIRVSAVGEDLLAHELEKATEYDADTDPRYSKLSQISKNALTIVCVAAALVAAGLQLLWSQSLEAEFSLAAGVLLAGQVAVISRSVNLASAAAAIKAISLGVLVRSRTSFEQLANVNHVVFKKTGVLTLGPSSVGRIHLARNTSIGSESELLALAASVELGTSHELGHLIIQEAAKRGLELPQVSDFATIPGLGVSARFDGSLVQVGNAGMVNVTGVSINPYDLFQVSSAYSEGSIVVFVSIDELLVGYIEFPDELRVNSPQAIVELSGKQAITVLSGDATSLVERLTQKLGLSDFAAEVLSTRQADWIKERRANGSKVLLVGDGHYDAAALVEADVAIAFGAGHDVHLEAASLIQISQDPLVIPRLLELSKKVQSRTLANIVLGLVVSAGLIAAGFMGASAPEIALTGLAVSWILIRRIVRLAK
jgi:Cu2+-exporting ATPase